LGVLREIEGIVGDTLDKRFDLIFGTSTGAIIAALLALGYQVDQIHELYKKHVPAIMGERGRAGRSAALKRLADEVFGVVKFDAVKTGIGIVATKWLSERPMIFKGTVDQAHGMTGTFVPGFGCTIADAVRASCSAFPFFDRTIVTTAIGDEVELIDGGYCANNPTLYAIADALLALKMPAPDLRVVSVGVGVYPSPPRSPLRSPLQWAVGKLLSVQLLQKTLEINTQSMEQLRAVLFRHVPTIRINDTFEQPEMATDLLEHDLKKLNILRQRGRDSFGRHEAELRAFLE
jgi:predicted acylesterase/phospholipase RssA